jgi:hypothetical protein
VRFAAMFKFNWISGKKSGRDFGSTTSKGYVIQQQSESLRILNIESELKNIFIITETYC